MISLLVAGAFLTQLSEIGTWEHVTVADGLPAEEVRAVLGSSTGAVWFAVRAHGLAVMDQGAWSYYTTADGLVSNGVADLREVRGAIWAVGQGGYSILRWGGLEPFTEIGGRATRVVFSLTPSADGVSLWLGASGFAGRWDSDGWTHVDAADGLPHSVVHQALTGRDDVTWFACRRGLARLRDGTLEVFHPDVNFRSIVEDGAGRLWFGTAGHGVFAYSEGDWEQYLDGQTILPSVADSEGTIWAITEGAGVYRYDGEDWTQYTTDDGLLSNVVYDIELARDGSIWFGTDRGASGLTPR